MKNKDKDFNDYKMLNADSITVNRNPDSNNNVNDSIGEDGILRFDQTSEEDSVVSFGEAA